ncbi:MAG: 4Fe-4S dicluster domain-containing protein [Acidobacteriia bacterium]|nr:4Fe-4S dicluster domain-containing protein [Terriglobia bacterium]MBZ5657410.1 4Fe-4S dicluster domain-containing protein [Terriglobia bacterium]
MELKRTIKFEADRDPEFARWISHTVGGERIRHCLQCGLCSASCPLSLYMDYTPRRLMHLSREGFKEEVLSSSSIWLCTACYACMVECPKKINITHLMYALKQRAIEERFYPKRFPIPVMAQQFSRMVRDSGRITESWLILRVFLRTAIWRLLGMSGLGWKLFIAGRMTVKKEKVERRAEIRTLLDSVAATRKELAL